MSGPESGFKIDRARQGNRAFNVAMIFFVMSGAVTLVATIFLIAGQLAQSALALVGSTLSGGVGLGISRFNTEANDRYDRATQVLSPEERVKAALAIADKISDPTKRDDVLATLAKRAVEAGAAPALE